MARSGKVASGALPLDGLQLHFQRLGPLAGEDALALGRVVLHHLRDGLLVRQIADDTGHVRKTGKLAGLHAAVAGYHLIPAALPGADYGGIGNALVLDTLHHGPHFIIVPDLERMIFEGVQLRQLDVYDLLYLLGARGRNRLGLGRGFGFLGRRLGFRRGFVLGGLCSLCAVGLGRSGLVLGGFALLRCFGRGRRLFLDGIPGRRLRLLVVHGFRGFPGCRLFLGLDFVDLLKRDHNILRRKNILFAGAGGTLRHFKQGGGILGNRRLGLHSRYLRGGRSRIFLLHILDRRYLIRCAGCIFFCHFATSFVLA